LIDDATPLRSVAKMSPQAKHTLPALDEPAADKTLRGVLALMAADRDERIEGGPPRRSELVLADAGFTASEIAQLTGRNGEAVRSALRRRKGKAS
jgi:DNA-directed RNA polymerase specialized sigma24 family protein